MKLLRRCDICHRTRLWFHVIRTYDMWGNVRYTLCKNAVCPRVLYMLEERGLGYLLLVQK